jgi:hypothetical protein
VPWPPPRPLICVCCISYRFLKLLLIFRNIEIAEIKPGRGLIEFVGWDMTPVKTLVFEPCIHKTIQYSTNLKCENILQSKYKILLQFDHCDFCMTVNYF